ncbi:MAG: aminotransferase class I/II-fold pyridoxal phosphate-dependent enzyme [Bacteroidota bacterium]|nr:aminotransferase class I/II-fold pyridoxal phosphate-dependent enzyme [Bacteroidota bacterium]
MKVSKLAESLIGSEIVKLGNTITERIKKGEKIYNYTIGDFDSSVFPIPALLEQYIVEAYQKKYTNYPPADGIALLRKSVAAFLAQREGLVYADNEIQIASGGRPLIYALFETLIDPDDKVIYGVPSWNNNHYVHLTQGQHCTVVCTPENNFMPTAEDIAPHIKGATLLCLCTPQNPTGTTLSKEALQKICDMVLEENDSRPADAKKLYVMFDQMYWTLTYGNIQHYNPISIRPSMREYTIFIDGISKAFAATGVRVGWACGPAPIIAKMKAILSHLGAWAPMAEQQAVAKYLGETTAIDEYLQNFKKALAFRLNTIYKGIKLLQQKGYAVDAIAPQAAIYLTVQINLIGKKTIEGDLLATQDAVTDYILSEAKIAIVPFYAFGGNRDSSWYRLSVGTCKEEDIEPMLLGLEHALAKLH